MMLKMAPKNCPENTSFFLHLWAKNILHSFEKLKIVILTGIERLKIEVIHRMFLNSKYAIEFKDILEF